MTTLTVTYTLTVDDPEGVANVADFVRRNVGAMSAVRTLPDDASDLRVIATHIFSHADLPVSFGHAGIHTVVTLTEEP